MSTVVLELPYPCISRRSLGWSLLRVECNVAVVVTCILSWFNVLGIRMDVICK